MNAKTLLLLPPWSGRNHSLFLGTCDLRSFLVENGIEVEILDCDVISFAAEREGLSINETISSCIKEYAPSFVGIHINTPNYESAIDLAKLAKETLSDAILFAGGPHASVAWREILMFHREIDFVIRGEGEDATLALIQYHVNNKRGNIPPGVCGRLNGQLVYGGPRTLIQDSSIPFSDRAALLDSPFALANKWAGERYLDNFYNSVKSFENRKATNAYIARGCICNCPYCSPGSFWKDPKTHKPCQRIKTFAKLEKELEYLRSKGFGALYFDEMAMPFYNEPWLKRFASLLNEYDFLWGGSVIFRHVQGLDLASLAQNGLRYLYFGYETPMQELQHSIRKETDESDMLLFLEKANCYGIQCDLSMFFGSPGETDESILRTIEWLNTNLPRGNAFFSIAAIWPGTEWAAELGVYPLYWEPDFDKDSISDKVVWYPHSMTSVGQFFSNSLGTYHPAFMSEQKALWIKQMIIESGFRNRFAKFARSMKK